MLMRQCYGRPEGHLRYVSATSITKRPELMKTYRIEVQRIKSMSNAHGMLHAQIDAAVLPATPKEDGTPTSWRASARSRRARCNWC